MANLISLFRVLLCWGILILLSCSVSQKLFSGQQIFLGAFFTTIIVIWLDGVDGYVARKFHEESKLGAVIDILGDRVVEYLYWLYFLSFGWVPLWIPLVVIIRGVIVDGLRSIALEQGYTAFGTTSMMRSPLGVLLVSSRFSRWSYAAFKAIVFSLMILVHTPDLVSGFSDLGFSGLFTADRLAGLKLFTDFSMYVTVVFCIIRGLPVMVESKRFFTTVKIPP